MTVSPTACSRPQRRPRSRAGPWALAPHSPAPSTRTLSTQPRGEHLSQPSLCGLCIRRFCLLAMAPTSAAESSSVSSPGIELKMAASWKVLYNLPLQPACLPLPYRLCTSCRIRNPCVSPSPPCPPCAALLLPVCSVILSHLAATCAVRSCGRGGAPPVGTLRCSILLSYLAAPCAVLPCGRGGAEPHPALLLSVCSTLLSYLGEGRHG